MKKILIFSLAYYPHHVSGAEASIREITNRISPEEIEFHLMTLRFEADTTCAEKIDNVYVHRIGFGGVYLSKILFIPLAAFRAYQLHKRERFTGLWSMMTYMVLPVVLLRMVGLRLPYVLTLQDGDSYEKVFGRWYLRPFVWLLDSGFRNATVIQVISEYLGTWPQKRGSQSPVVVVHNGANPRDMNESVSVHEITALAARLGKKEGDVFLVTTSRLVYQKGIDDCIRALSFLPEHIKLVVVGAGPDEFLLKTLTAELGLTSRVMFVGHVERSEVTVYRKVADIFLAPSRSEGLGNAFLSALASRVPLIATRVGGMADFVFDGITAWVVEPNSPEQIAHQVTLILSSPTKARSISEHARSFVVEQYNWDMSAHQMLDSVFSRLV